MPEWLVPVLGIGGSALLVIGTIVGAVLTYKVQARRARTEATAAAAAASTAAFTAAAAAEDSLVSQLQKELERYREATDKRLERLETENTAYRRYVFDLIDHGHASGIKPLPWPSDIPR